MLWASGNGAFRERVLDELQDSGLSTLVPGWYNAVADQVNSYKTWSHFEKEVLLEATAPYSTGTVDVTNGSATVTGNSTVFPAGAVNQVFKGPDGREYRVLTRDSDTQLTLTANYIGDTATEQSYTVVFPRLELPSGFHPSRIDAVVVQNGAGGSSRLTPMSQDRFLDYEGAKARTTTGDPRNYIYREHAMYLWPPPSEALGVEVYYRRSFTRITVDTSDTLDLDDDWPVSIQEALILGVVARGFRYQENFDQATAFRGEFGEKLQMEAAKDSRGVDTGGLRMRRFDERGRGPFGSGTLPRPFPGT